MHVGTHNSTAQEHGQAAADEPIVHFIKKWLKGDRPPGVAVYASRAVNVDVPFEQAYAQCIHAVQEVLGGTVESGDAARGVIEARFGLVHSERITVSLDAIEPLRTNIRVQARRGVAAQAAPSSQYVEALCGYLMRSPPK